MKPVAPVRATSGLAAVLAELTAALGPPCGAGYSSGFSCTTRFLAKCLVSSDQRPLRNTNLLLGIVNRMSDALRFAAVLFQDRERDRCVGRIDHIAKAGAHVENLEHLAVVDVRMPLYEREDRMRIDQAVDLEADFRLDPRQIEQAIAGNIYERL